MSSQKTVTVTPPNFPLNGKVAPPGSKSITNRALLLAALATGTRSPERRAEKRRYAAYVGGPAPDGRDHR